MSKPNWLNDKAEDLAFTNQPKTSDFATVVRRSGTPKIFCKGTIGGPTMQMSLRMPYDQGKRLKDMTEGPHSTAAVALIIEAMDDLEASQQQVHIEVN